MALPEFPLRSWAHLPLHPSPSVRLVSLLVYRRRTIPTPGAHDTPTPTPTLDGHGPTANFGDRRPPL